MEWLRRQPDQSQLVADCYYDDPLSEAAERYRCSEEWQAVRELLPGVPGKALDVGAGRGIASYALAREGFNVIALEPDTSNLVGSGAIRELAIQGRIPIKVVEELSERLPFEDDTFDLIFGRAVLHHIKDLQAASREFFRVLKPGGRLVAIREHVISRREDLPVFLEQHPLHRLYGGENAMLLRDYVAAINQAGFTGLRIFSPWNTAINFAPHSLNMLKRELACRAGLGISWLERAGRILLDFPGVWTFARWALSKIDRRAGRLYSFAAVKS